MDKGRDISYYLKHGNIGIKNSNNKREKYYKMICCRCLSSRRTTPLACILIFILILAYSFLGGYMFFKIESPNNAKSEAPSNQHSNESLSELMRVETVERLWTITENLNILYKENWTKLANQEIVKFHRAITESLKSELKHQIEDARRWTFANSFLYSLTLITTIGNGNISPTTLTGRTLAVAYSCLGVPLIILYLFTVGEVLARKYRYLYAKFCPKRFKIKNFHSKKECLIHYYCNTSVDIKDVFVYNKRSEQQEEHTPFQSALNLQSSGDEYHWMCRDHTRVPTLCSILIIGTYVTIGALIFEETEGWDFIDACYFSFSVLATIGTGYLRPGLHASKNSVNAENSAIAISCLYILFGVVVVAVCFNLIHDDIEPSLRRFTSFCTRNPKPQYICNGLVSDEDSLTSDI